MGASQAFPLRMQCLVYAFLGTLHFFFATAKTTPLFGLSSLGGFAMNDRGPIPAMLLFLSTQVIFFILKCLLSSLLCILFVSKVVWVPFRSV